MRISILAAGLISVLLSGCVTTESDQERELRGQAEGSVGPLLKKQIAKRIESLKYQRGIALLDSLNWLILYGDDALPQLTEALQHPDPRTRAYSAFVMGEVNNRAVIATLRDTLADEPHKMARYEMAASLVTLGDWAQIGVLVEGLAEENKRYRHKCFEVLKKNLNITLGFEPNGDDTSRRAAVAKWRAWWAKNRDSFSPVLG